MADTVVKITAYLLDKEGKWNKSYKILQYTDIVEFLNKHVDSYREIRLMDSSLNSTVVMKIVNGELMYPAMPKIKAGNKWCTKTGQFLNKEDHKEAEVISVLGAFL